MDIAFPWPFSQGEWLAFWAAVATSLIGLLLMLIPRMGLALLAPDGSRNGDVAALARALPGGFLFGLGLTCILLAQQMLYLSLAMAWSMAAIGSLLGLFSRTATRISVAFTLLIALVLAGLSGAYALGFVS